MAEVWIHSADGTLVPDLPFYLIPGTEVEIVDKEAWGENYVGMRGIIDEKSVRLTEERMKNLRDHHKRYGNAMTEQFYAHWTFPPEEEGGPPYIDYDYTGVSAVKVLL